LSEGDVRLPKLFRQTVTQRWPGGGKTAVTELVAWSLDQSRSIIGRLQRAAVTSVLCSSHSGVLSRRMKIRSCGFRYQVGRSL